MQLALDAASRRSRDGASESPDTGTTASSEGRPAARLPARVGPNTLIQTVAAVRARLGSGWATHVSALAELPDPLPGAMVDERLFARLVGVLVAELGPTTAEEILSCAGVGTGEYVLRNRIPPWVRRLLPALPHRLALRVLLRAVRAHAWTFAGSARFEVRIRPEGAEFTLSPSLVCVTAGAERPMGGYYARSVEVLVRSLVTPTARVAETDCVSTGAPCCRFRIVLAPSPLPAPSDDPSEDPCASS